MIWSHVLGRAELVVVSALQRHGRLWYVNRGTQSIGRTQVRCSDALGGGGRGPDRRRASSRPSRSRASPDVRDGVELWSVGYARRPCSSSLTRSAHVAGPWVMEMWAMKNHWAGPLDVGFVGWVPISSPWCSGAHLRSNSAVLSRAGRLND